MYLFGNMILSPLATLIAAGAIFGYKLFKGEYFKQLPIFISVISVIIVTLDNLVVIPLIELKQSGYIVSFKTAIIKDYVISLIFTILGISGVIKNLKNQVTTEEN